MAPRAPGYCPSRRQHRASSPEPWRALQSWLPPKELATTCQFLYRPPPTFGAIAGLHEPGTVRLVRPGAYHRVVPPEPDLRAVIFDWGGVLTPPVSQLVRAWVAADQIDWDSYLAAIGPWLTAAYEADAEQNPVHWLERGECTVVEFEQLLGERLVRIDGGEVAAEGMLARMMGAGE